MMTPYYQRDDVTLYCADCLELLPQLEAGSVDCVVTDPPYGIYACGGKWGRKQDLQWDRKPANVESLLYYGDAVIWGGNYFRLPPSRGWLVWHKRDAVPSASSVELAWTNRDMNCRLIDCTISETNRERNGHPTLKPVRVMQWSLGFVHGQTILDPFTGSGTTAIACIRTGRKFIGIEIEEKYCEIAAKRIERELAQPMLPCIDKPEPVPQKQLFQPVPA